MDGCRIIFYFMLVKMSCGIRKKNVRLAYDRHSAIIVLIIKIPKSENYLIIRVGLVLFFNWYFLSLFLEKENDVFDVMFLKVKMNLGIYFKIVDKK